LDAFSRGKLRVMILASGDLWAGAEAVVYELCSGLKDHALVEVTAAFLNEGVLAGQTHGGQASSQVDGDAGLAEDRTGIFITKNGAGLL